MVGERENEEDGDRQVKDEICNASRDKEGKLKKKRRCLMGLSWVYGFCFTRLYVKPIKTMF